MIGAERAVCALGVSGVNTWCAAVNLVVPDDGDGFFVFTPPPLSF